MVVLCIGWKNLSCNLRETENENASFKFVFARVVLDLA